MVLENLSESSLICDFLKADGVITLAALFAINTATFAVLINTMVDMERSYRKPFEFDNEKRLALSQIREMLLYLVVFYLLVAAVPSSLMDLQGLALSEKKALIAFVVGCVARACIFQTMYCTYDFLKSLVILSTNPNREQ